MDLILLPFYLQMGETGLIKAIERSSSSTKVVLELCTLTLYTFLPAMDISYKELCLFVTLLV